MATGNKVKIGGKVRGIQFGMGAIELYCDILNCDLEQLDWIFSGDKHMLKAIPALVYAGLTNYEELKPDGAEETFTLRQVQAWLDECTQDEYARIIDIWKKSKYMGITIEQYYFGSIEDQIEEQMEGTEAKPRAKKKAQPSEK